VPRIQKYSLGDVVNLEFPNQENGKKSTYRPAIIVEDLENEAIIIFVTKQLHQQPLNPDSFVVDKDSDEGKQMGLGYHSLICPRRQEQIRKILINPPPRGRCSQEMIEKLEEFL